ncbi:MAG: hypothetical protein WDN76_11825 [Alphaproteobacteria bacterium]
MKPSDIEWFMERGADRSPRRGDRIQAAAGVKINQIPGDSDIGTMLERGELDAALLYLNEPNLVDRARSTLKDVAVPLFPDAVAESRRFYAETKLYPINHTLVVRRTLMERHPWIVLNLYHAFCKARDLVRADAQFVIEEALATGRIDPAAAQGLADDPAPYGLAAGRVELERVADYVYRQGLTPRRIELKELFAPSTLDL